MPIHFTAYEQGFTWKLTVSAFFYSYNILLESREEAAPKEALEEDYEHIFHSIPTLFEYLLDILQERPEILEKDDVTFFQEVHLEPSKGEVKREVHKISDDDFEVFKRNIGQHFLAYTRQGNMVNNEDFTVEITTDVSETVTGEFSEQINDKISTITDTEITTEGYIDVNKIIKQIKTRESHNGLNNKLTTKLTSKSNKNGKENTFKGKKRNIRNYGDSFFGSIDWSKFYLSPEEVEDQALKIEQAIEDHNKKKETWVV